MSQTDALTRLDVALDALENNLGEMFAESGNAAAPKTDPSVAAFEEQARFLTEERDQLLAELEVERGRVRRLKSANEEVSGRLDTVIGTLRDMLPAMPG